MIIEKTILTGKGQIQIPARIRRAIGAERGDTFLFMLTDSGEIQIKLMKKRKLSDLAGALPVKRAFPGIDEEEELTQQKVAHRIAQNG